ncbi:hypothetical protein SERLA73DRAFT_175539 [Serpula lacrymans var. lacrymans S7.3]|uniref:Ubiquitin-like domain-containing protein n=2 Tax=Serpula lacrymans var. lacrymans TaxID=341189 RepID=F8PKE3_SERL3|nr:uncharacterized protein SERLADRAFT_458039 [Serpula lacrymans var. lacrymans S7.9]EGO03857.1 hypothetical protein SERLA73DRAFT_175539 [Serpula lacrymans var. lacrymans S7.3]EGO29782.1 hypothetical protein SERLADRAFT_458039 [Serpula lacrymans var. lacrymans S7.9]
MADQAELVFVKSFINTISSHPVRYVDDYQQPPQSTLKKVPVLSIDVPPVPERKVKAPFPSVEAISVTFKSLKPPQSFTLSVQPTDTISDIKAQLASQPRAPPADAQRLLIKGKVLADAKLLKEYTVKEGDTVNLMIKPGFDWDPSKAPSPPPSLEMKPVTPPSESSMSDANLKPGRRHQRIPSVVLSPSPSMVSLESEKPQDINLTLDTSSIPTASMSNATRSTYQTTISQPPFWDRLYSFLRTEFAADGDALTAFEDFLRASKGGLTASEIAKIRDHVGVVGMAGT